MSTAMLDPDLRDVARLLVTTGRLRAEDDPVSYRAAVKGRKKLVDFFRTELGWPLEVQELGQIVVLHKTPRRRARRSRTVRAPQEQPSGDRHSGRAGVDMPGV